MEGFGKSFPSHFSPPTNTKVSNRTGITLYYSNNMNVITYRYKMLQYPLPSETKRLGRFGKSKRKGLYFCKTLLAGKILPENLRSLLLYESSLPKTKTSPLDFLFAVSRTRMRNPNLWKQRQRRLSEYPD